MINSCRTAESDCEQQKLTWVFMPFLNVLTLEGLALMRGTRGLDVSALNPNICQERVIPPSPRLRRTGQSSVAGWP